MANKNKKISGKGIFIILLMALLFILWITEKKPNTAPTKTEKNVGKWYEGGQLHDANIGSWKKAKDRNKLATCADYALTVPNIKKVIQSTGTMDALKPYAINLVSCIDEATKDLSTPNIEISTIAAACIIVLKWN